MHLEMVLGRLEWGSCEPHSAVSMQLQLKGLWRGSDSGGEAGADGGRGAQAAVLPAIVRERPVAPAHLPVRPSLGLLPGVSCQAAPFKSARMAMCQLLNQLLGLLLFDDLSLQPKR